jgi:hypothetical protein
MSNTNHQPTIIRTQVTRQCWVCGLRIPKGNFCPLKWYVGVIRTHPDNTYVSFHCTTLPFGILNPQTQYFLATWDSIWNSNDTKKCLHWTSLVVYVFALPKQFVCCDKGMSLYSIVCVVKSKLFGPYLLTMHIKLNQSNP